MKCNIATWKSDLTMGVRKISLSDSKVLGEVMYEAYKGTIDYSDETGVFQDICRLNFLSN